MTYILFTLSVILLIIIGIIVWLLILKKRYESQPEQRLRKIQKEKEVEERKVIKKEAIKEESLRAKVKEEPISYPSDEVLPKKEKAAEKEVSFQGASFEKTSRDPKQELEEIFIQEIEKIAGEFQEKISQTSLKVLEEHKSELKGAGQKLKTFYADFFGEMSEEKKKIKEQLNEMLSQELSEYQKENLKARQLLANEIQKKIEVLLKEMDEKVGGIYQPLEEAIKAKMEKTEKEIEKYKKEKLKETEQKIYRIIESVIEKVVGKTINLSTHEDLVIEALKKAKAENLFLEEEEEKLGEGK